MMGLTSEGLERVGPAVLKRFIHISTVIGLWALPQFHLEMAMQRFTTTPLFYFFISTNCAFSI